MLRDNELRSRLLRGQQRVTIRKNLRPTLANWRGAHRRTGRRCLLVAQRIAISVVISGRIDILTNFLRDSISNHPAFGDRWLNGLAFGGSQSVLRKLLAVRDPLLSRITWWLCCRPLLPVLWWIKLWWWTTVTKQEPQAPRHCGHYVVVNPASTISSC